MSVTWRIEPLGRDRAQEWADVLGELLAEIPGVSSRVDDVFVDVRADGRVLTEWPQWSRVAIVDQTPVGVLAAYRRAAEDNEHYPEESLYIGALAVHSSWRGSGCASALLESVRTDAASHGVQMVTVQTNAASWNSSVRALYQRHGFVVDGHKDYDDRRDVIMRHIVWPGADRTFSRAEAQQISGLSPREVADWARAGVVPTMRGERGRLSFTGHAVLVLSVIAQLRSAGVAFAAVRQATREVSGHTVLKVDGVTVDLQAERHRIDIA